MAAKYSNNMTADEYSSFGSTDHIIKNGDSSTVDLSVRPSRKKGWFVTPTTAFIGVLAAIALAAIVGLIVGLAHPDRGKTCPLPPTKNPTSEPGTTAMSPEPPVNIRLPTSLIPSHYNLRLRPDIYASDPKDFKSTGSVEIILKCMEATNVITVHARDLVIDEAQITVKNTKTGVTTEVTSTSEEKGSLEFYKIHLKDDLEKDETYSVRFGSFQGKITDDLKGIYYSSYQDGETTKYLLTSQFQPVDGRKVFPCMDEPNMKASFNLTLEIKKSSGYWAMSNSKIYNTEDVESDWEADYFEKTPTMSLYLLAMTISDFDCVTNKTMDGLDVDVCSRPNAFDQTAFASTIAVPMQDWFAEYHDVPFPLKKNTHVAVPDFSAGAMENWGLIIYRETALLFDPASSTSAQRQRVAVVVSHELAHMWFGNLVTMKWWDDVWLNEGFASYMEVRGVNSQFPEWDMDADFVVADQQYVFTLDALPTSHPVYLEVNDPAEISQLFDTITYSKGSSVIRMMRNFLGEETFRKGLSNYLKDRAYQEATHQELFKFLTEQAKEDGKDIDVHAVMNTWIRQMGFPVVTFNFDKTAGKISLTQKRFLLDPDSDDKVPPSDYNYIWKVPITYATDKEDSARWNESTIQWLDDTSGEITGVATDAKWIIGNLNSAFYYRVNYDDDTWEAIKQQLTDDHKVFTVNTRSQLIDDAFSLGRAGVIEQTVALEISSYLNNEESLFPWSAFRSNINYFSDMLVVTGAYGNLQKYVQKAVSSVYQDSLWNESTLDPLTEHVLRKRRSLIISLACGYGVSSCSDEASKQFQAWMAANITNPIEEDLRPVAYCQGLAAGGQAEWEFAYQKLAESNSGAQSQTLINSLGCTTSAWLLRKYMEEAIAENPPLRRQDFRDAIRSVASNSIGRNIAWETFVENYDTLLERFGASQFTFASIVNAITYRMSTQYEHNMVESFMNGQEDLGTAETAFKQALDKIKVNIAWKENNQAKVIEWLKANA